MAPPRSPAENSGGGVQASIIPTSGLNDVYGVTGLSQLDLKLLKKAFSKLNAMSDKSFKIVSTISGVDMRFAPDISTDDSTSQDDSISVDSSISEDVSSSEVESVSKDSSILDDSSTLDEGSSQGETSNDDHQKSSTKDGRREVVFYGPDNIPRIVRHGRISRVLEIELWLYGGALNNINGIIIKPRGYDKPFNITAGKGASVDRSCQVELVTPLCGDPVGEMTVRPRKQGIGLTRYRKGQCFARLLCFDDRLGLTKSTKFDVCVDKDDSCHSIKAEFYMRDFSGHRPLWSNGSPVKLVLGIKSDWYKIPLHQPSSQSELVTPLSKIIADMDTYGIRIANRLRTKLVGYHRERIEWDPVMTWDTRFDRVQKGGVSGGSSGDGDAGGGDGGNEENGNPGPRTDSNNSNDSNDDSGDSRGPKRRRLAILPGGYVVQE